MAKLKLGSNQLPALAASISIMISLRLNMGSVQGGSYLES